MISRVDLGNFRCFSGLKLPLRPLTVLSGLNASGKSSVMQAMALLQHTMREDEWSTRLILNGATVRLGTAEEVVDRESGGRACGITVHEDHTSSVAWQFSGEAQDINMTVDRVRVVPWADDGCERNPPPELHHLIPATDRNYAAIESLRSLAYLTSGRLAPKEFSRFDNPMLTPFVGPRGEFAAGVLYSGRNELVSNALAIEGVAPTRLRQVEARMKQVVPGCVLEIVQDSCAIALVIGCRTGPGTGSARVLHLGRCGLTQIFPVFVAALTASENDILLIENPETRLHPSAQAKIGAFLAQIASTKVQVLIETHRDHVLNGMRWAVKDTVLSHKYVAICFFRHPPGATQAGMPQVTSPAMGSDGNMNHWPTGFFDQFDDDMNYFAGWS